MKLEHTKIVTLKRDNLESPWKYDSANKTRSSDDEKVLETKKHSDDEYKALKTIKELAEEAQANATLDALPKVEVPAFKSGEELMHDTYKMLRTATPGEMEAYLRQVYSPWWFIQGSTTVMHDEAEKKMKQAIARALEGESKFKDQYCSMPVVKEGLTVWNKDKSSWTRMSATPGPGKFVNGKKVPGTYKLSDLQVSILKGEKLERLNSYTKDLCPKPLTAAEKALGVPKADGKGVWKIGDKVSAAYKKRNRWYAGTIAKIKGDQVFVKYSDGDSEWTTAKYLKSR